MKKPCNMPGCPNLTTISKPYCPTHQHKERQYKRQRHQATDKRRHQDEVTSQAARFRSSRRWQKIRRIKLATNPLCEDPHGYHASKGSTATATQIHHIESIATNWERRDDLDNLMSVCSRCHAVFNQQERQ